MQWDRTRAMKVQPMVTRTAKPPYSPNIRDLCCGCRGASVTVVWRQGLYTKLHPHWWIYLRMEGLKCSCVNWLNETHTTDVTEFTSLFMLPYIHLYPSSLHAWNKTESMFKTYWTVLNMSIYSQEAIANTHNAMQLVLMHQVNTVSEPGGGKRYTASQVYCPLFKQIE